MTTLLSNRALRHLALGVVLLTATSLQTWAAWETLWRATFRASPSVMRQLGLGLATYSLLGAETRRLQGRTGAALTANERAQSYARLAGDRRVYLTVLLQRVFLLQMAGYLSAAESVNQSLLREADRPDGVLWQAGGFFQQAVLDAEAGRYEQVIHDLEKTKALSRQVQPRHPLERVLARQLELQSLAILTLYYHLVGHQTAADSAQSELAARLKELGFAANLLLMRSTAGLAASVAAFHRQGIRLDPRLDEIHAAGKSPSAAGGRVAITAAHATVQRRCAYRGESLATHRRQADPGSPRGQLLAALRAFQQGRFEDAIRLWGLDVRRSLRAGSAESAAPSLASLSRALWYQHRFPEAIDAAAAAVACLEEATGTMSTLDLLATYHAGPGRVAYQSLLEMLVLEQRPREAFLVAEQARARALLRAVGADRDPARLLRSTAESTVFRQRLVDLEKELARATGAGREAKEKELLDQRRQFQGLTARTALEDAELGSLVTARPVDVDQLQAQLDSDVTLISFFVTDQSIHAWVVERDSFEPLVLPLPSGPIVPLTCRVETASMAVRGSVPEHCMAEQSSLVQLYQQLFEPLLPFVHHSKLILIPHGPLHSVPFAALREPATGRYLIEDFTLTYVPSASALRFLRAKESPFTGKARVWGAPEREERQYKAAVGMGREAVGLGKLLAGEVLLGPAASEAALAKLDGTVDIVHFAAHGEYMPASPRFSRIVLATGAGYDGNLEVHEIYSRLDLSGVNLVVLAACQTATGEPSRGDEIESLMRGFLYAGSPGVVSSLWNADDAATEKLMNRFYRRWKAGSSVAEALRGAQIELLREESTSAPYYWAGFTLTGDPKAQWGT